jgi:hypothetical protein
MLRLFAAFVLLSVGSSCPPISMLHKHAYDSGAGSGTLRGTARSVIKLAAQHVLLRGACECAPRAALRGGSWLFTPKIVPVSDGDGGVVQWRQQPAAPCHADSSGSASGCGVPEGPAGAELQGAPDHAPCTAARLHPAARGVQQTNDDSTASKASASRAGYFRDGFVELFVGTVPRRTALINRGYFARVHAVRSVIAAFLDACNGRGQPCQILSLGAGFDTAYWVMKRLQKLDTCTWVEVDFPETVCPGQIFLGAVGALFLLHVMHTLRAHVVNTKTLATARCMCCLAAFACVQHVYA